MKIDFTPDKELFSNYFSTVFFSDSMLLEGEAALAKTWAKKRIDDFSTGRYCAREALKPFGYGSFEILKGSDKEPLWPKGIVGSISHAEGLAGAVVADAKKVLSAGLDIEVSGRVNEGMWYLLFTETEQTFLKSFDTATCSYQSTLLFSLKESFYKFQFPFTKTFLNFTDVEIQMDEGRYAIRVLKDFPAKISIPLKPVFSFLKFENHIITLCYSAQSL